MREQQNGKVEERYGHVRHHPVFGSGRSADGGTGRVGGRGAAAQPTRRGGGPGPVRPAVVSVPSRPGRGSEPWPAEPWPAGSWRRALRRAGSWRGRTETESRRRGSSLPGSSLPGPWQTVAASGGRARAGCPVDAGWAALPAARSVVGVRTRGRSPIGGAPRVLVRHRVPMVDARTARLRRLTAGVVLVVTAALVVVALGLLADAVAAARLPSGPVASARSSADAAVPGATAAARLVVVEVPGDVWELADRIAPGEGPVERAALVGRIVAANALPSWQLRAGQVLRVPSA